MATEYVMDVVRSKLTFTAIQQGAEFEGGFGGFAAEVEFDPQQLERSVIRGTVDLATIDTKNPDRDLYLKNEEWFNVPVWPTAVFETNAIREDGSQYLADASLRLRHITGPVQMRFSFEPLDGDQRRLTGPVELTRLDFGVGQGDWRDTTWVGNPVTITIDLYLTPVGTTD